MKIIICQQLLTAKDEHVWVNLTGCKVNPEFLSTSLRFTKCSYLICCDKGSVNINGHTNKSECTVEVCPHWLKAPGLSGVAFGLHRLTDELHNCPPVGAEVLSLDKSVMQSLPFGHVWRRIGHFQCG